MLTKNEVAALSLSPTKKDFVQIWNELLEVAGKLSERWDPTSTNESDPGIVILKALTGIADKLNYNIDKNILEAFMPTAAQEDSMRKLCDMLGYSMKYYRSAVTEVTIKYYNPEPSEEESQAMADPGLLIPKFTVVTNGDQDISYFTTNQTPYYISAASPTQKLWCMEGQIVKCESANDNDVITANQITENNRFYLPETQIAENGIFIYNVFTGDNQSGILEDGTPWEAVTNLNTQARGTKVFKFGFDSYEGRPYVEFPEDYSELFSDGIFIYYARTSGINGNISPRTLTQLELPSTYGWDAVSIESFSVENASSATSGANAESIKQAYTNFKKTIGTFETLVTCRDYMNKIYSLTKANGKPLVSNILVTDIRNDLNRAVTICSCDNAGIFYKETPLIAGSKQIGYDTGSENQITYSEYEQVGEVEYSGYEQEGLPVYSEYQPVEAETVVTESVVSTANMPVFKSPAYGVQVGDILAGNGVFRATCWRLGSGTGIPLFADKYDSFVEDYNNFDAGATGDVVSTNPSGEPSSVWYIVQDGTYFKTKLPITRIDSTATTIKEQRTETIKEHRTGIIKEQRTETIVNAATKTVEIENAIDHFDLVFYPFKSYNQIKSNIKDIRAAYDASFTYAGTSTLVDIKNAIEDESVKTVAHNIKVPENGDIISINNYLRLTATIATNAKVTVEEGALIVENIKIALANAFNMRELDFGEEIPFDSIVEVIEKADARIKVASLNEPALYTTFSVFEDTPAGTPVVTEYAVASDWLDVETAESTGRLTESTFDTKYAREIYNKLAVRNVLAGRVPLFDYNNTFKTSFTEGAYRVTDSLTDLNDLPSDFITPSIDNPYTVQVVGETVYTGQYELLNEKPDFLNTPTVEVPIVEVVHNGAFYTGTFVNEKPVYCKTTYTKTYTPETLQGNIITGDVDYSGKPKNYITDLKAHCMLPADTDGIITDVTLAQGELVKFRAPNFTTTKTFPAYVNYHLALAGDKTLASVASPAEARSLFEILNVDISKGAISNYTTNWQKVLNYFKSVDETENKSYVKTFTIQQTISAYTPAGDSSEDDLKQGEIIINVDNTSTEVSEYSAESLMALSGCVKLTNNDFTAKLEWTPKEGESKPAGEVPLTIKLGFTNPFVTDINVLAVVKEAVQTAIAEHRGRVDENGNPMLPTQCAWTVSFTFDCVPFEAKSLQEWKKFIKLHITDLESGFTPVEENGNIFWRKFGEGYDIGKYVTEDTAKLLPFGATYFGLLPETYLQGIYIANTLGIDAFPSIIKNGEEYQLRQGEYLYIEYTPSATTDEGTAKELTAITETYGAGTIFRPNGFEVGIIDSSVYHDLGNSFSKTVTFAAENGGSLQVGMHSLGANEQIELREYAKVTLTRDLLANSSVVYIYKNFNNCQELESIVRDSNKNRINNSYILKDGEYIFYTDQNKSELAYFTSGTQVTLYGDVKLPQYDIIELSDIFDYGIQDIPWTSLTFDTEADKLEFQEYQYITLGTEDTLKSLVLENTAEGGLDSSWKFCSEVEYSFADDPSSIQVLPSINLGGRSGNGWEASSTLELAVSPSYSQTLRSTPKIKTSLDILRTSTTGGGVSIEHLDPSEYGENTTIAFKTNIACLSCGDEINITNVIANPGNSKSFQLKVFANDPPMILDAEPGKVVPYKDANIIDLAYWRSNNIVSKDSQDLWSRVDLEDIRVAAAPNAPDKTLQLSVSLLPNTYGVFCLYIDYKTANDVKTWLELLPGTSHDDITLMNAQEVTWEVGSVEDNLPDKLLLNPGINCVRVNKNCKVYVKTSTNAKGVLLFDELRLVNSKVIKYTDTHNRTVLRTTQGLNLKQLEYLDTFSTADSVLDDTARADLKKAFTDQAFYDMQDEKQKTANTLSAGRIELVSQLPKVNILVAAEKSVEEDLIAIEKLAKDDPARLASLISVYNKINTALANENALLEALKNSSNTEALEQQLAVILANFADSNSAKRHVLSSWSDIKAEILANTQELTDKFILTDFTQSSQKNDVFSTVKSIVARKIHERYMEQLTLLAANLEQVVSSDDSTKLSAILKNIQAAENDTYWMELNAKVAELGGIVNTDIDSLLEDLVLAAVTPDYVHLLALLTQLRNIVDSSNVKILLAEIEQAAEASNDVQLKKLIEPLFKADGSVSLNIITNSDIIAVIDTAYTTVQSHILDTTVQDTVIKAINSVKEVVSKDYATRLSDVFKSMKAILDAISKETDLSKLISSLENSEDNQVTVIMDQLNDIIKDRNYYIEGSDSIVGLNAFTDFTDWTSNVCAVFIRDAIIQAWPEHIYTRLTAILDPIDRLFDMAITGEVDLFDQCRNELIEHLSISINAHLTDILLHSIRAREIIALFDEIESALSIDAQNIADANLISQISTLVPVSAELTNAIMANANGNAIITKVLEDYTTATDIRQKQQALVALRDELNSATQVDYQLFSIISTLLWPNITKLEADSALVEDAFYQGLFSMVKSFKSEILSGNSTLRITIDTAYQELLALSDSDFEKTLLEFSLPVSLLPPSLITTLVTLKENIIRYNKLCDEIAYFSKQSLNTKSSEEINRLVKEAGDLSGSIKSILDILISELYELEQQETIDNAYVEAYKILLLEDQLLSDIRAIDVNREFYYNAPIEDSLAIEFNEISNEFNTLMNPAVNYDINNINNSFVISKLDIDYLTRGIQIARSSRYN